MKKKYVFEIIFRCGYIKRADLKLFSEEFHPYVTNKDPEWLVHFPFAGDYQVRVVKNLWSGCYVETTQEDRMITDVNTGKWKKAEEKYYETYKHSLVLSQISRLKDQNYKILNLKSDNDLEKQLCQILIDIGEEPIEIRFKVEYNKSGVRT